MILQWPLNFCSYLGAATFSVVCLPSLGGPWKSRQRVHLCSCDCGHACQSTCVPCSHALVVGCTCKQQLPKHEWITVTENTRARAHTECAGSQVRPISRFCWLGSIVSWRLGTNHSLKEEYLFSRNIGTKRPQGMLPNRETHLYPLPTRN